MDYPLFYDDIKPIRMHDPLAEFLGALDKGEIDLSYLDCVKLAGHSCPTVAGAYLMTRMGLDSLYKNALPRRSEIKVELRGEEDEGVVGVVGNVIGYITGAGGVGGFKGIGVKFGRNGLISYGADIDGDVKLTRVDNGESVTISYNSSAVPGDPDMKGLMQKLLQGKGSADESIRFGQMWQERTEKILLHTNIDEIITIKETK